MNLWCHRRHLLVRSNVRFNGRGERKCLTCSRACSAQYWREIRKIHFEPHEFAGRTHCAECYRIDNRDRMKEARKEA